MPSDRPNRLRRATVGSGPNPPDVLVRSGLVPDLTPVEVVGGEVVGGSSHPGAGHASAIGPNFLDTAEVKPHESPTVNTKSPFALKRNPY